MYDELFSTGEYEMHRKQFELLMQGRLPLEFYRQHLLKIVERRVQNRKLVEIGGGTGSFGIFCTRRGWEYVDYDISPVAVEYAQKLGLQAHVIESPDHCVLPPSDVIAMWEVIEHIWNVHEYLKNIRNSLGDTGYLLLSTPNYYRRGYRRSDNWGSLSGPPVHVNFFTEESISATLKSVGFSYVHVIKPRFYRPVLNLKSIWYSLQILFGAEPTKTLYVVARGIRPT
jgi:SAM-dependent methyltransferase